MKKIFVGTAQSGKYQLNKEDLTKLGVGALVAVGGALLTYLADTIPGVDFGVYTPVVVAIASILINSARKFLQEL
jgi:ABC-type antimicrobial peptide transport system permease subunit